MGKRIVIGSLVVVLLLLLSSSAALAEPGGNHGTPPGHANKDAEVNGTRAHGAHANSQAPANASRGMNRPGAPGSWKSHGHTPAPQSFPQGNSPSDPDFTGNGGRDKPGETGGFSADRDGNNGCGNDDDAEDDNNGWCGNRPREVTPPPPPPPVVPPPGVGPNVVPRPRPTVVLSGQLPVTGVDAIALSYAGLGLMLTGQVLRKRSRRRPR